MKIRFVGQKTTANSGGCKTCGGRANRLNVRDVALKTVATPSGKLVFNVKPDEVFEVDDADGMYLADVRYEYSGVLYQMFEVV